MATTANTPFSTVAYRRDVARRLGLTGFGAWWRRELSAAVPARLRGALERRRMRPVLSFDGNVATLWRPLQTDAGVRMAEAVRIPLDGDPQAVAAGGRAALAPLVGTAGGAAPAITIALPRRAALRKTLTLPAALEDNLRQALAYDLDRHTPFKADELYFDAAIVDRDPARNMLHVDLVAARRAIVDPMLRHAESFGARIAAVVVDPPASAASTRLNLLPAEAGTRAEGQKRWQAVALAAILIAGALAALVVPVWQKRERAIALHRMADEALQRAQASDALRTELERRVGDYNFALERKYAFPGAVQVLDDVTRILPDDTWLTQLELRTVRGKEAQRELTLRGESANAGRLVSLLENSQLFTQAAPRSPTTKIQPGPGEIFDVSAQLKPAPMPPAAPLDLTAPPPAPAAAPGKGAGAAAAPAAAATTAPAVGAAAGGAATLPPAPGGGAPAAATATPPSAANNRAAQPAGAARTTPPPARPNVTRTGVAPQTGAAQPPAAGAVQPQPTAGAVQPQAGVAQPGAAPPDGETGEESN
jgi:general secretion pathway protein L